TSKNKKSEKVTDILSSPLNRYEIHKILGQGVYGKVVECKNLDSKENMAVKIVQKNLFAAAIKEVSVLKNLRQLDENNNLVRFIEYFHQKGCICLVFEKLDKSLHDFLKERSFNPLTVPEIRVIAQQMLVALNALKSIGVTHGDIKPDNIMLVNHMAMPFRIKLIDFGLASSASEIKLCTKIQAVGYRAPEVTLGCPINEAIDMWSLGCVLAFMYLGRHLYPLRCEYESMRILVKLHGQPDDNMLNCGLLTRDFFTKDINSLNAPWRMKTQVEYSLSQGCTVKPSNDIFEKFASLDDIAKTCDGEKCDTESEDTRAFISLLKHILRINPEKRINPRQALGHRFITLKHFPRDISNSYVESSALTMKNCNIEPSLIEIKHFVTSSEVESMNAESSNLDNPLSLEEEMNGVPEIPFPWGIPKSYVLEQLVNPVLCYGLVPSLVPQSGTVPTLQLILHQSLCSFIHSFIHFLPLIPLGVAGGGWSLSQHLGAKAGYTLDESPVHRRADI
uniref:Protein kinase domain-containing protein n=1 Tax=Mola mola TaxID=94237 RepID=A0A3Q3XMF0_MOLML